MRNKKAELGLSTLILFISVIIVSIVVFFVFFDSVNAVNQKATTAGHSMIANVGTASTAIQVFGEDASVNPWVEYFYMDFKAVYASEEFKLGEAALTFALANTSQVYTFNGSLNCTVKDAGDATSVYNPNNSEAYGAQYLNGGATYPDGAVVGGEQVRLCWKSPIGVHRVDPFTITFLTKQGLRLRVEASYPDLMDDTTIYFFP